MKRIGIEVNGVLRNTIDKFKQLYEKHMIENYESENSNQTFEIDLSGNTKLDETIHDFIYEIVEPIDSYELKNHFIRSRKENEDELSDDNL